MKKQVSVVIPALNAAARLAACLGAAAGAGEIIVVDGGSADATREIAQAHGARVIAAPAGRGGQLRAGVAVARLPLLLLLHADTVLPADWARPLAPGTAGYYRLRFESARWEARVLEAGAALRCRLFGLPYGDQGLLISAELLGRVGGVPDLPLMEDVELARRLRGRLVALGPAVVTSAARYERDGFLRRPLRNLFCLGLFLIGVPARWVARLYG